MTLSDSRTVMGEAFLGGFILAGVSVFVLSAVFIWKPRMYELMAERDMWRDRALEHPDDEIDLKVLGDWGSAYDFDG